MSRPNLRRALGAVALLGTVTTALVVAELRAESSWVAQPHGWIVPDYHEAKTLQERYMADGGDIVFVTQVPDGFCVQTGDQYERAGNADCMAPGDRKVVLMQDEEKWNPRFIGYGCKHGSIVLTETLGEGIDLGCKDVRRLHWSEEGEARS